MKMSLKPPALVVVMALTGRVRPVLRGSLRRNGEAQQRSRAARLEFSCHFQFSIWWDYCGCRLAFLAVRSAWARDLLEILGELVGRAEHRIERALDEILLRERRIVADRGDVVADLVG